MHIVSSESIAVTKEEHHLKSISSRCTRCDNSWWVIAPWLRWPYVVSWSSWLCSLWSLLWSVKRWATNQSETNFSWGLGSIPMDSSGSPLADTCRRRHRHHRQVIMLKVTKAVLAVKEETEERAERHQQQKRHQHHPPRIRSSILIISHVLYGLNTVTT